MTISELIDKAGGVATVAAKLNYSVYTVIGWKYRSGVPSSGTVREQLCRLAGKKPADVEWDRKGKA